VSAERTLANNENPSRSYTISRKHPRNETVDVLYGILSIGIAYMHSQYANGFSITSFGSNIHVVKQLSSLIFHTFVPIFLILYGYLSYGSFFSPESNGHYVKRKLIRLLPLYMFFLLVSMQRNPDIWRNISALKTIFGFMGLYYESGITSGQIVFIVNITLLTRVFFARLKLQESCLLPFLLILAFVCNIIIRRPAEHYILRYFGY